MIADRSSQAELWICPTVPLKFSISGREASHACGWISSSCQKKPVLPAYPWRAASNRVPGSPTKQPGGEVCLDVVPVTSYPVASYQLPVDGCQLALTSNWRPVTSSLFASATLNS